jgi:hypothetical protein
MHLPIRLAVAAVLSITVGAALAQDNAVVLFDATHKTVFCVVPDISKIVTPPINSKITPSEILDISKITEQKPCAELKGAPGFLVQGQRDQLQVIKRKFLTRYAFFVDKVTPVQNFPIEALNEAANLGISAPSLAAPASKGAVPKGLATSGALTLRSAQDLIAELLNPATSSNPVNEIASDWLVVKREAENVQNDAKVFQATWNVLNGTPVHEDRCLRAYEAPTLNSTAACLRKLNHDEWSRTFTRAAVYSDEDGFRKLIVNDNDAIAMVTLLGSILAQKTPLLTTQLSAFDGDLASLRADMNTLAGNVQAIEDALDLLDSMKAEMTKAQIKARLIQQLNSGSKPVLDDAELNRRTDDYYYYMKTGEGHQKLARAKSEIDLLSSEGIRQACQMFKINADACTSEVKGKAARLASLANQVDAQYSDELKQDHVGLNRDLPSEVARINALQSSLLARVNEIYDKSEVAVPLDKPIDLGGNTGNLRVYFTIYETETFPRFAIPAGSSTAGPVVAATPVTVTSPAPAAPASPTATTPPTQPSGTPVTSGVIEVHDRYKATMVAAFAFSRVRETSITTIAVTTGTAAGSIPCTTTAPCTQVTVAPGPHHSSVIVGLSYHPWGYDTFPGAYSWRKTPGQVLKQDFGIFAGLSVQNLNDYYAGADFQIAHGLQFMGGVNLYRQSTLAAGYTSGGIYPGVPNFTGPQRWTHGGYFGLGLNLSIFRKAFGAVTGLGAKAATNGS